jgi:hypothetical protein
MSDNHGNTPAAWTAVIVGLAGFVVAGIGLMLHSWPTFWVGVVLAPVAIVLGAIMSKMGYGASH